MKFKDFYEKENLVKEFDEHITNTSTYMTESNLGDLEIGNVIMSGLDTIKSQDVKAILGVLATVAELSGKRVKDIIKLFSKEGFNKIKNFIDNDILGSEEIKYMRRMKDDPNRYKGFKGLEQYIRDMEEHNPKILDSIKKAVDRIVA